MDNEKVFAANIFVVLDPYFAIGKILDTNAGKRDSEHRGDGLGELRIAAA